MYLACGSGYTTLCAKVAQNYIHTQVSAHKTGGSKACGLRQCQFLRCDKLPYFCNLLPVKEPGSRAHKTFYTIFATCHESQIIIK